MKQTTFITLLSFVASATLAQSVNKIDNPQMLRNEIRQEIRIPDIAGYKAIKGDFHLHTIFSDGSVLPRVRVEEAWSDGLDVIAITDHIEYRPNREMFNADHNTSYNMALERATEIGIHLIKATELTGNKEDGGHINALFITDANPMERKRGEDLTGGVEAAISQGAYLIWNHPGWAIDTCKMFPLNEKWIKEGKIKAVEVFNEKEYYPRAVTWSRDLKLAPISNSDAHASVLNTYAAGVKRPYNIILSCDNSMDAIREAMFAGRVIAVFDHQAAATEELLKALFESCTSVVKLPNGNYKITNNSDLTFTIRSKSLNCTLLPDQSCQFAADKNFEAEVTNLHVDEGANLKTMITI